MIRRNLLFAAIGGTSAWPLLQHRRLSCAAALNTTNSPVTTPYKIKLYQYEVCPFCNKARAFLDYHRVPYEKVEVNPLTKTEMKFSTYRKVPFSVIETPNAGQIQVNESSVIIDWVAENVLKSPLVLDEDTIKWRKWVDDHLIHLLPPNIYRTPSEALQAFEYISNQSNFSSWQKMQARYSGAVAMYFIAKRSVKKYNLSNNVRQDLYDACNKWAKEGLQGRKFHGSDSPDVADISVFGVFKSLEGNYETWKDMKANASPEFWTWYENMRQLMPKQ